MTIEPEAPLTRKEKLRRVVILCAAFCRNLAYQRAMVPFRRRIAQGDYEFWTSMSNNALDAALLNWCALFADKDGKHHWSRIVGSPEDFEPTIYAATKMTADDFAGYLKAMRVYRDKFVAHLDGQRVMDIPDFGPAELAVGHLHDHVARHEAAEGDLNGLPNSAAALAAYYKNEERVAGIRYDRGLDAGGQ